MKNLFLILIFSLIGGNILRAQDCDIRLMTIVDDKDQKTPAAANEFLYNRLSNVVVSDGVSATGGYSQFFLASRAFIMYEQVVAGPPAKIALTLSLNLYIGDYFDEKVFSRTSFEIRGVGESRERAYLNAYRSIKNNDKLRKFIQEGKSHIINYYDKEYPNILKEAERLSAMRNYERALFILSSVPTCCKGYEPVSDALMKVYQKYIDYNCQTLLMKARTIWAAQPDVNGALEISEYLNQIDPNSSCYGDVMALYEEVKSKVKDDWNFEFRKKYEDQIELKRMYIDAARSVGVAYGEGQQPTTTNLMWMR